MIYILILNIIILMMISYILSNNDYMSPTFLMISMFLISVSFVCFMRYTWLFKIQAITCIVILLGIISFCVGYYIVEVIFKKKYNKPKRRELKYINISKWKTIGYYVFSLIFCILYIKAIINTVGFNGEWSETMIRYRYATAYKGLTGMEVSIPGYILFGRLIVNCTGYIYIYICINNYLITKKWDKLHIIAILISVISSILGASRLDLIRAPIAFITIYYILKSCSTKFTKGAKFKLLLKYIVIAFIIISCFSGIREFVGRKNESRMVEYIAQYLAAPIVLLDDYLKNPIQDSQLFGKESFWGIYNFIASVTKKSMYSYDYTLEFRKINGINFGNVYTAFRMYYHDFGFVGIIVMDFLLGMIFAFLYGAIKYNVKIRIINKNVIRKRSYIDFKIIIYSLIIHSVILMFYADWFFSQILSWLQIKSFIIMWIIKYLLIDFRNNIKYIEIEKGK